MTHTTKHTPGPWVVRPDSTIESKDGVTIASLVDNEADMSIISAAQVMYAVIKDMREAFYVKGTRKALLEVMERSKDVIAQAEGGAK